MLAIRQHQRCNEVALIVGLEYRNGLRLRIGHLLRDFVAVRIVDLELGAAPRNDLAVVGIYLHHTKVGSNRFVMDDKGLILAVCFAYQNGEVRGELNAGRGLSLTYHIGSVRQAYGLPCLTVCIGDQRTALILLGILIGAGRLEPILELRALLKYRVTAVDALDKLCNGESTVLDLLHRGYLRRCVVLNSIFLGFRANRIYGRID